MVIKKQNIVSAFQYELIYFLILSCGAQFYDLSRELINNVVIVFCSFYLLLKMKHRKYLNIVLYLVLFVMMMGILTLFHNQPYTTTVMTRIIENFMIAYVAFDYDKEKFCTRYVKFVSAMSIISLGFYVVQLINPSVLMNILKA